MAKFIKVIKTEVLDVDEIVKAAKWNLCRTASEVRMVMSRDTYIELHVAIPHLVFQARYGGKPFMKFCGCPIDYNDSLGFGEILFTVEL